MRDRDVSNPPKRDPRILWTSATLVIVGLSLLTRAAEWFATFDACVANPACTPGTSSPTLESYLGIMMVGITLTDLGLAIAFHYRRGVPRRALILWLE
jgi:hypothetical protein